jgi:integrase
VYLKHGAYWFVKGGKWRRLGDDLRTALAAYASIIETPTGGMAELIDRVLTHTKSKLSKNTVASYATAARRLKKLLIEFAPREVQPKDVAAVKIALAGTPNFANRCLSLLRVVFAHAVEWQLVDSNPCIGILRHDEHKRDRYLSDEELAAIREKSGPRLQVVIDLLYFTAQRVNDVLAIRRADITTAGVRFIQHKTGVKLTVGWSPEFRAVVDRARTLNGNIRALTLLHNRRGKAPDYRTVKLQWDLACKAAGIEDAHMHDIRAKALTDAKREGADATALAGHTSAKMTERYIRLRESPVVTGPRASFIRHV